MRRNRRNNVKKERIIMIASSAFVLSALTMTGIYMKSNKTEEQDDGYMLDFTALEESVPDKAQEIARNEQEQDGLNNIIDQQAGNPEDDLDYLPMEAGSGMVTIPGLTDGLSAGDGILSLDAGVLGGEEGAIAGEAGLASDGSAAGTDGILADGASGFVADGTAGSSGTAGDAAAVGAPGVAAGGEAAGEGVIAGETEPAAGGQDAGEAGAEETDAPAETPDGSGQEADAENTAGSGVIADSLHFAEGDGLLRPVSGEVLIPFSMDSSVYFSTLDQFKYNPAMMIAAAEGSAVTACAEGVVTDIFQDSEIGYAVTMDLGSGYQITYGQLSDISVTLNDHVQAGAAIASIAAPTKYFSVEGSNLYLKLTADGTPVNPEALFR